MCAIEPVLQVQGVSIEIPTRHGTVHAARDVDFALGRGERLGIVGESGSGKTITALGIMRLLLPPAHVTSGRILFEGRDVTTMHPKDVNRWRGNEVGMIFQDPLTSLNPFLRIGIQVAEVLEIHRGLSRAQAMAEAEQLLRRVQISDARRRLSEYPHQLSGGMRQRVVIAIAMATRPKMIIADEPTTALDVTAQANVLDLLRDLTEAERTSVVLITHDLSVIADFCERVLVMYAGRIVEEGSVDEVISEPRHPYTQALLNSIPRLQGAVGRLPSIPGAPPDLTRELQGCPFAPRCPVAYDRCRTEVPELLEIGPGRRAACHLAQPIPSNITLEGDLAE